MSTDTLKIFVVINALIVVALTITVWLTDTIDTVVAVTMLAAMVLQLVGILRPGRSPDPRHGSAGAPAA